MSAKIIEMTEEENTIDVKKRAFMSKFGKYAVAGVGMTVLMTPTDSSANPYGFPGGGATGGVFPGGGATGGVFPGGGQGKGG